MLRVCVAIAVTIGLLSGPTMADSVPAGLRHKTISVAWTSQRIVMTPRGEQPSPPFTQQRTIYVSNEGRFFVKAAVQGKAGAREAEMAPGEKTAQGGSRDLHFSNGRLMALAESGKGVGRMTISFDQGFSSCTVDLGFARPAGERLTFRNPRGVMVELLDVKYSGQRCSIQDGNAFAR